LTGGLSLSRRTAAIALAVATAIGAAFRFYGLNWAAPFFHFHIDEHLVFGDADTLRTSSDAAAMLPKFFMYSPLPMYALNGVRSVYEHVFGPLTLTTPGDEVTYMVLGRAISAFLGTATIPLVYLIATRIAGRLAGVLSAFFLAAAVIRLRESHFFTVDMSMAFFSVLTWYWLTRTVQDGGWKSTLGGGISFGLGILSKYTAAFVVPLIGIAELLSPQAPKRLTPWSAWLRPVVRSGVAVAVGLACFLIFDPLVLRYYAKFRSDIKDWVTDPLMGVWKPIWIAQFADVNPTTYWFTNLLWWGLGPALEIWALIGLVWLFARRDRVALLAGLFPLVFWLLAGRTIAPFVRYAVPLAPPLAVAAGVLSADLIASRRWRLVGAGLTAVVLVTTTLWAYAYMHVYSARDSRLVAAKWISVNIPNGARVLVEPSHNIPPMGTYFTNVNFYGDYVLWSGSERQDSYHLVSLDVYRYLYDRATSDEERRRLIQDRLAAADWIVMDDTFLQFYQHLPESSYGVVKQYYRDLFEGRLGFRLVQTFKVYPRAFGRDINDDGAELTFRLFDHPRVFVFKRT